MTTSPASSFSDAVNSVFRSTGCSNETLELQAIREARADCRKHSLGWKFEWPSGVCLQRRPYTFAQRDNSSRTRFAAPSFMLSTFSVVARLDRVAMGTLRVGRNGDAGDRRGRHPSRSKECQAITIQHSLELKPD